MIVSLFTRIDALSLVIDWPCLISLTYLVQSQIRNSSQLEDCDSWQCQRRSAETRRGLRHAAPSGAPGSSNHNQRVQGTSYAYWTFMSFRFSRRDVINNSHCALAIVRILITALFVTHYKMYCNTRVTNEKNFFWRRV